MQLDLTKLDYTFQVKPLLIGGKAMEFYSLRKAGNDIDFVITAADYVNLAARYPQQIKDLYGDLGVCLHEFELWQSIMRLGYDYLAEHALEADSIRVIALDKLLVLKALGMAEAKYERDLRLIVQKIQNIQYGKDAQYSANHFERELNKSLG